MFDRGKFSDFDVSSLKLFKSFSASTVMPSIYYSWKILAKNFVLIKASPEETLTGLKLKLVFFSWCSDISIIDRVGAT